MEKIKLLIVDDSDFVRDGLKVICEMDADFEVVGTASNGQEALALARRRKVDVVLMDLEMPVLDGIEATRYMTKEQLCKVLVLTTFDDDERIQKALENGASGYLIKNMTPDKIKQMIKAVANGGHVLDEKVFDKMLHREGQVSGGFDEMLFTARERDVIKLVAEGLTNKMIAERLYISEGTVKNHISMILEKGQMTHRTQIAVYYLTGKK